MPIVIAASGRQRRKVRFTASTASNQTPKTRNTQNLTIKPKYPNSRPLPPVSSSTTTPVAATAVTTDSQSSPKHHDKMCEPQVQPGVPGLFTTPPLLLDALVTETSEAQAETVSKCLPFLKGTHSTQNGPFNRFGVPALMRDEHVAYLFDSLEDYPEGFVAMDASRPWLVYWALAALSLLREDTSKVRERVINTFMSMQNPAGGFGGGHGQLSHCASSYAAVLSLAMIGGEEAYSLIDREKMWRWLGRLKQPDGGFGVCEGGEEDVRGAYCAMVIISLLDLPLVLPPEAEARHHGLETFDSGLSAYLSRCQTFEGGISGSPGSEAHGAYAFCALACLCILGQPEVTVARCMDIPLLLSWLSARQYAPEGGFSGRTNKLVDGCYSHWVGSCWPLIQSALDGAQPAEGPKQSSVGNLYSREGLTRYILGCCQAKFGGLRDKPGKHVDSYHTCYTLAGLSTTQHHHYHTTCSVSTKDDFASAFSWQYTSTIASDGEPGDANVFDETDRVAALHPLYVIPHAAAESMRLWCERQPTWA